VRYDLLEQRALANVSLFAGPTPLADDGVELYVGNAPSAPPNGSHAACASPPPFAGAGSSRVFDCAGLHGRYVFTLLNCSQGPGVSCFMNYAGA
jgi:hypothetical protein